MNPGRFRSLLAVLCLTCHVAAAEELVVAGGHFERIFERTPDGEFTGLGPEVVRLVARQLGHTVRFELYPWARAQVVVAQGKADILVGPYQTPERQQRMAFSRRPFFQDQILFYARGQSAIAWQGDYAALAGERIVVINGWTYGERFEQARSSLQISVANSVENGLRMVAARHVALLASNRRDTEPVLARLGLGGQLAPLPYAIEVKEGYFAFPRLATHDGLRQQFDAAFAALAASGELKRLCQRFDVSPP
ncbi:MAG: transporter substrate-binding domain-containing protein [Pseudomonadota bacterium]